MKQLKNETLSIRTSSDIKQLLRMAAEKEHRSIASMIEVLILSYAQQQGLTEQTQSTDRAKRNKGSHGIY